MACITFKIRGWKLDYTEFDPLCRQRLLGRGTELAQDARAVRFDPFLGLEGIRPLTLVMMHCDFADPSRSLETPSSSAWDLFLSLGKELLLSPLRLLLKGTVPPGFSHRTDFSE